MQVRSLSKNIFIGKSRTGNGLFTDIEFKQNKAILELKGRLITCFEDDVLDENTRSNTIRYSSKYYLSPKGELGDYLNHSCEPNSYIYKKGKKLFLKAAKDISPGEEITIDYSTVIAADDVWKMKCYCQSPNCRNLIKSFNKLPKKIRDNYLSRKMVPGYIYKYGR
jgi:uncharacterized protein